VEDYIDELAERAGQFDGVAEGMARTVAKRSSLAVRKATLSLSRARRKALPALAG
jgi:DNA-binding ferritin-like protein